MRLIQEQEGSGFGVSFGTSHSRTTSFLVTDSGRAMARTLAMSVETLATSLNPKNLDLLAYRNIESLQPHAPNPRLKPQTLNPRPATRNPKPETRNHNPPYA